MQKQLTVLLSILLFTVVTGPAYAMSDTQWAGFKACLSWCIDHRSGAALQACYDQCDSYWSTHRGVMGGVTLGRVDGNAQPPSLSSTTGGAPSATVPDNVIP